MTAANDAPPERGRSARQRVIDAAGSLFTIHGVRGTSLRMVADEIGVGKAAVYFQFRTKYDLVTAVVRSSFNDIASVVTTAKSSPYPQSQRATAIDRLVNLAVCKRTTILPFRRDPEIDRLVSHHSEFSAVANALVDLLIGTAPTTAERAALAVALAGLGHCATDSALNDLEDAALVNALQNCFIHCINATPMAASLRGWD